MKDIELVIKIPEDIYKDIIKNGFIYDEDNEEVTDVIKNGTPLKDEVMLATLMSLVTDKDYKPNLEGENE